jgi:hypothetical protein
LSDGLHGRSDQECLEIASSVRVVLMELSERLSQALKDEADLNHAVSKLLAIKNKADQAGSPALATMGASPVAGGT